MTFLMATLLTNEEILAALRGKTKIKNSQWKGWGTCVFVLLPCGWCERKSGDWPWSLTESHKNMYNLVFSHKINGNSLHLKQGFTFLCFGCGKGNLFQPHYQRV